MAAATVIGMLVAAWPRLTQVLRAAALQRAARKSSARMLDARLTDLPYAPHRVQRGTSGTTDLQMRTAATEILLRDPSTHARGRAALLINDTRTAVEQLRKAAETGDPAVLSDLSAALLAEAEELDVWEPALDAVVAARHAIDASPGLAPAHFNLALALDRLGLTPEARAEFNAAARLEPGSRWAAEAVERASAIPRRPAEDLWKLTEQRLKGASEPAVRRSLILADPYLARINAEGPYLTDWARARIEGRVADARAVLEQARVIASVLQGASQERLALDAIAAIDHAESHGSAMPFARAHLTYFDGRIARKNHNESRAIELLMKASDQLAAGDSPLQYVARYHIVGALFEQGRINDALRLLKSLEAQQLWSRGYRGLAAQLGWEHGICLIVRGEYAEALDVFDRSRALADGLGEHDLAARFDGLAAEAMEYLGESNNAWRRRIRALRAYALTGRVDSRRAVSLTSAAQLQIATRNWERAEALLDYAIPLAAETNDALVTAQALAKRSVVRDELRDAAGAAHDRIEAAQWAQRVDRSARERLHAEMAIAEGVAQRVASPRAAIAQFTHAIDLFTSRGQTILLPRIHFERARTYEAIGDLERAEDDLRAGLGVVETWEQSVTTIEQRAAISIWSEAIRRDIIATALARGNVASAFAHADGRYSVANWRANDSVGPRASLAALQPALARDAAILEIVPVHDAMIVFVVRAFEARAIRLPDSPTRIIAAAEAMRGATDRTFADRASALYDKVIAPIRRHLEGVATLVVVPGHELSAIPFGALRDITRNRYLIEDMAVVHAPTAIAAMEWSRRASERGGHTMIAIGSSVFDGSRHPELPPLPHSGEEALRIASQWRDGHALTGNDATVDRVRRELRAADVVHYSGHIIGRGADARFVLAPEHGSDSLSAREIAQLPLHARIVVLAGCRGADMSAPQMIIGDVASGFLAAGVPAVVASATDIDDREAPDTMRRLHDFLTEGDGAAEAVRKTVLRDLRAGRPLPLSLRLLVYGGSESILRRPIPPPAPQVVLRRPVR